MIEHSAKRLDNTPADNLTDAEIDEMASEFGIYTTNDDSTVVLCEIDEIRDLVRFAVNQAKRADHSPAAVADGSAPQCPIGG